MKKAPKKLRRLRLERETLLELTPDELRQVAGGDPLNDTDTRHNSCDLAITRPVLYCCSVIVC